MKVLYALQGTGNGHVSRAMEIIPVLRKKVELDILISGTQADLNLPFEVTYRLHGLSFVFGQKGGINLTETWKILRMKQLIEDIRKIPVQDYDLVINDFEPVSAWACKFKKVRCIALSHQWAVLHKKAPRPSKTDMIGRFVLANYAPSDKQYGFHFKPYTDHIFTPIIRREIRYATIKNEGHYTVYLPAYGDDALLKVLSQFPQTRWQVFSKHSRQGYQTGSISVTPVNNRQFIKSFVSCEGIICGAGFETPAEALYLGKKMMVVPMSNQFEQQCNATALQKMGIPVLEKFSSGSVKTISDWLHTGKSLMVNYPDETEKILDRVLQEFS